MKKSAAKNGSLVNMAKIKIRKSTRKTEKSKGKAIEVKE